jgi:hypothetical protein
MPATRQEKTIAIQTAFRIGHQNVLHRAGQPWSHDNSGTLKEVIQLTGDGSTQQRFNTETANELRALADVGRPDLHNVWRSLPIRENVADP